jgi:hypothetical protein
MVAKDFCLRMIYDFIPRGILLCSILRALCIYLNQLCNRNKIAYQ